MEVQLELATHRRGCWSQSILITNSRGYWQDYACNCILSQRVHNTSILWSFYVVFTLVAESILSLLLSIPTITLSWLVMPKHHLLYSLLRSLWVLRSLASSFIALLVEFLVTFKEQMRTLSRTMVPIGLLIRIICQDIPPHLSIVKLKCLFCQLPISEKFCYRPAINGSKCECYWAALASFTSDFSSQYSSRDVCCTRE